MWVSGHVQRANLPHPPPAAGGPPPLRRRGPLPLVVHPGEHHEPRDPPAAPPRLGALQPSCRRSPHGGGRLSPRLAPRLRHPLSGPGGAGGSGPGGRRAPGRRADPRAPPGPRAMLDVRTPAGAGWGWSGLGRPPSPRPRPVPAPPLCRLVSPLLDPTDLSPLSGRGAWTSLPSPFRRRPADPSLARGFGG